MNSTVSKIKKALQPIFARYRDQILFCYCFGSLVTNTYSNNSDVDLAFYVHPDAANYDFKLTLYAECSRALKRNDIDIVILNDLQNLILSESIARDGILLYDSEPEQRAAYELKAIHNGIDFRHQRRLAMGI
ncbi:MAG: nucleotidyltransferase domain-containing protein [candidate division KSB1 bacterium]|nr:nucleotidyltransferase domain-containing protein [candidate division KSB1 bacterium]MDZ7355963.1 nucleotidyltransferase domain-containing protein [candidate division KSB1 bacterium]